jgi:hypothetical protein
LTYVKPCAKEFLTFITTLLEIVAPWALWLVIAYLNMKCGFIKNP